MKAYSHSQPFSDKNKGARKSLEPLDFIGDRERIRTAGLPLRRRSLYPAELHNQASEIISQTRDTIKTGLREHDYQRYKYKVKRQAVNIFGL